MVKLISEGILFAKELCAMKEFFGQKTCHSERKSDLFSISEELGERDNKFGRRIRENRALMRTERKKY